MKRMTVSVLVEEKEVNELSEEIIEVVESRKGKANIQVSDAPPAGSGATLGDM